MLEAGDDCTKRLSLFRQPSACRNSPPTFSQISAFCTRPALAAKIEVADLGPSKPPGKGLSAAAMKAASPFVCLLLQICRREKAAMWEEWTQSACTFTRTRCEIGSIDALPFDAQRIEIAIGTLAYIGIEHCKGG